MNYTSSHPKPAVKLLSAASSHNNNGKQARLCCVSKEKTNLPKMETRIAARKQKHLFLDEKHSMFPSPAVDRCLGNDTSPIVLCVREGPRTKEAGNQTLARPLETQPGLKLSMVAIAAEACSSDITAFYKRPHLQCKLNVQEAVLHLH